MLRCPACRTNQRTLLRFGVYLCPACGETDADGVALSPATAAAPAPASTAATVTATTNASTTATATAPATASTAATAFAAPPVPPWSPPGTSAVPLRSESSGPPRILVLTIGWIVFLDFASLVLGDRSGCSLTVLLAHAALMFSVLSGAAWARAVGLFLSVGGIAIAGLLFAGAALLPDPSMVTALRVIAAVSAASDAFYIYVLVRADVTAYFTRNAR